MTVDAFKQYLDILCTEYRLHLPQTWLELDRLWSGLISEASDPGDITDLHRELHTLVGTAKTMGLPAVTDAARAAEDFLEPYIAHGTIPAGAEQANFSRLLDNLKRSADIAQD